MKYNEVRYDNAIDDELWKWWNAEYENELGAQSNHTESNIFSHAMGGVSTVHQIDEIRKFKIVYFFLYLIIVEDDKKT